MRNKKNKKIFLQNLTSAFTLIEIMVAVSVFAIVMVISMGSILSAFNANQKAKTLRSVMDNLNVSLESMTRTIHFGTNYHCGSTGVMTAPQDCGGSGDSSLTLQAVDGSRVTYSLLGGRIARSINGNTNYFVTSPDLTITNLTFRVYGSPAYNNGADLFQPQVVIVVSGSVGTSPATKSTFTLETTVSQQALDFATNYVVPPTAPPPPGPPPPPPPSFPPGSPPPPPPVSYNNTYYVSTVGSDSNSGTIGSPWQTIKYGISQLSAGDLLYIRGGTYSSGNDRIWAEDFTSSGTDFNSGAITISAYPNETVTISGWNQWIKFPQNTNRDYIIIKGTNSATPNLVIDGTGYTDSLIYIDQPNDHIRLQNLEVKNSGGHMALIDGDYVELLTSIFHDTSGVGESATTHPGNAWYSAGNNGLVEGNTFYHLWRGGIRFYDSAHVGGNNNIARFNRIYDYGGRGDASSFGIFMSGVNNVAYDNIIYGPGDSPGIMTDYGGTNTGTKIYNNTIYGVSSYGINIGATSVNAVVKNNISYNNSTNIQDDGSGTNLSNNLTTSPSFVNTSGADFHLQSSSLAIDAGLNLGSPYNIDFAGASRPAGSAYDIGAYEYGGVASPPPASPPPSSGGGSIQLCIDINYNAGCETFTANDPDLSDNTIGNDNASSLINNGGTTIALYQNTNYGGSCEEFNSSDPDFRTRGINDWASSIKVGTSCSGSTPPPAPPPTPGPPPGSPPPPIPLSGVRAFPTAEGYGADALGGRGGRAIQVTNLNDSGSGSLRNCIEATGPRTCIFRVSGTIVLNDDLRIGANNSYLTIAGQTAPGGGIQLKNYELTIHGGAHDVVVRFIRSRPGLDAIPPEGKDTNAILIYGDDHNVVTRNIVIDHCEAEWATDQNGPDSYGNVGDITVQWSISSQPTVSGHSGDPHSPHSLNLLIGSEGSNPERISYHHNLLTDGAGRNPRIGRYVYPGSPFLPTRVDWRNNVVYNWGGSNFGNVSVDFIDGPSYDLWEASPQAGNEVNFIGNRFIAGPNSSPNGSILFIDHFSKIYMRDNWGPTGTPVDGFSVGVDFWNIGPFYSPWTSNPDAGHYYYAGEFDPTNLPTSGWNTVAISEFNVAPVTTDSASNILNIVLNNVGATKPARDSVTNRIINEVRNGTGGFGMGTCEWPTTNYSNYVLNNNPCVWPNLVSTTPPTDSDQDGIADSWESSHGLNSNDASDGASFASNGYTNLENYINELAGDPIP